MVSQKQFADHVPRTAKMLKHQRELSRHRMWEKLANPHSSYHLAWDVLGHEIVAQVTPRNRRITEAEQPRPKS
eukprot:2037159-Amphidinium_carterae.1